MKRKYSKSLMEDILKNKYRIMQFNSYSKSSKYKLILTETQIEDEASFIDLTSAPRKIDLSNDIFYPAPK